LVLVLGVLSLKLLKTGEDFGSIAVEQSIDPTANQAGYLGLFDPTLLRPELRDALKGIKPGEFSSVVRIPEGYAILKIDAQSSPGPANEDTKRLLALVAPGAVRYGPDVDGFNDAVAVFTNFPDNPHGWDRTLNPVKVTEIHQKPLSSALRHLHEAVPPLNHGAVPAKEAFEAHYLLAQLYAFQGQMDSAIEQWEDCYQLAAASDARMAHFCMRSWELLICTGLRWRMASTLNLETGACFRCPRCAIQRQRTLKRRWITSRNTSSRTPTTLKRDG
jgi:hypothetical protein